MTLINCNECGKEISSKAKTCIGCGNPAKKNRKKSRPGCKWEAAGFIMILIGLVFALAGSANAAFFLFPGFIVFIIGRFK